MRHYGKRIFDEEIIDEEIIELPDKVYIRESAYFTQDQEALYDQICEELRVEVEKEGQIVEDMAKMIKFYRDVLGFEIKESEKRFHM